MPHNGHGFVKSVDSSYVFEYHKATMGYADGDVIGFGAGALSKTKNLCFENAPNVTTYIDNMSRDILPEKAFKVDPVLFYSKPISTHLPYFGHVEKNLVDFNKVDKGTLSRLHELVDAKIIIDTGSKLQLTQLGWYWNHVIAYFLSPDSDRVQLDMLIQNIDPALYNCFC